MPGHIAAGPVHHLRLAVTDIQRSRQFYTSLLGFRVAVESPPPGDASEAEAFGILFGGVVMVRGDILMGLRPMAPEGDRFDPDRVGLDHLSFGVPECEPCNTHQGRLTRCQVMEETGMAGATTTLITGANKGIGYETARRLIMAGHTVWLGCRDTARGERAAEDLGGRFVQLDVADDASVDTAVQTVGSLDVLVNNAGIMDWPWTPAGEVTPSLIRRLYDTNVVGLVRVMHAFLPLLSKSANPVVVNVGSSLGSLGRVTAAGQPESRIPAMAYGSSKAAVNMITVHYANAYPKMRINCVDPGYTATDLNGNSGFQTAADAAGVVAQMACLGPAGPTGTYRDVHGPLPW